VEFNLQYKAMSQHNQYPPQREAIVDKLHGALATFRRERDEVHRAKELAFERLRLAREERMAADRNLQSMKDKYDKMMQSMSKSDGNNNEVAKLQTEVERLSREVRRARAATLVENPIPMTALMLIVSHFSCNLTQSHIISWMINLF
jgi:ATPase subunit of ABC transporter with duplicated ATPase domains